MSWGRWLSKIDKTTTNTNVNIIILSMSYFAQPTCHIQTFLLKLRKILTSSLHFLPLQPGAPYGPNIRDWTRTDRPADLSQCFVAIDPTFFAPGFEGRMTDLMNHCRNMEPVGHGDSEYAYVCVRACARAGVCLCVSMCVFLLI